MKRKLLITFMAIMLLATMTACATGENSSTASENTSSVETSQSSAIVETEEDTKEDSFKTPSAPRISADASFPQYVIYESRAYHLTHNDISQILNETVGELIGENSGYIDFMGGPDESLMSQELANSISEQATYYNMHNYNDDFRIIVEFDGNYYVCESNIITPENILSYTSNLENATVLSLHETVEYKDVSSDELAQLVEIFSELQEAELTNTDYEAIAQAQVDGKAYWLKGFYNDTTHTSFLVIPELSLVSIGNQYYTSETLQQDIAFVFDGLPQEPENILH